ncbi:hypothetical protein BU14_0188s0033 [Porphyra umbilicalis]|uniref:Uncharacterized protein n=1 Tax=Porphyra umbilicalis TaxID=2786 RepID=A0A1X6P6X9_PORUM|nr:hypothetical protein BU14_0188s0033 [Porphyra umbilicalis]|eukprot:OSX76515.1 hypothetical protein BU14_0188s0033 [Porphyra umbilicalis]
MQSDSSSSTSGSPLFLGSARHSVTRSAPARSVPSVLNLAADDLGGGSAFSRASGGCSDGLLEGLFGDDGGDVAAGGDLLAGASAGLSDAGSDADEADGRPPVGVPAMDARVRGGGRTGRQYGQRRPGPGHGQGGRKKGSGRRTKEHFGRGLRRVMGAHLSDVSAESLATHCHVPLTAAQTTVALLRTWANADGREEVWLLPGVFGVVARWGAWRRDSQGDCASVCVWLAADGRSRCTCVGSNVHQDNHAYERPTTCQHAGALDALLEELAGALGAASTRVRRHFLDRLEQERAMEGGGQDAAAGLTFHVVGALYVSLCPSPFGVLPVPLYLTHTRSSCGICPGARTRVCSHLCIAQESGAPHRSHRASAQSSAQSLEVSAVSRLPIPLHDCVAAVRVNGDVAAKALTSSVFVVRAPVRCQYCTDRGEPHTLSEQTTRTGVVTCTRGFYKMEVHVAKCSSCRQWVARDGRDEHLVMLTLTSAATVRWVQVRVGRLYLGRLR